MVQSKTPGHFTDCSHHNEFNAYAEGYRAGSQEQEPVVQSPSVESLLGADSMIRLKLHIRKEGSLLQNMQRRICNLVGMSCPRKIRYFHKRFCNTVPTVVIALPPRRTIQPPSRPSQHEDPPPPPPPGPTPNHYHIIVCCY